MDTWTYDMKSGLADSFEPQTLSEAELAQVTGGAILRYAGEGFAVGGGIGTIAGAIAFGSVAGAGYFGTLGALIGGSFGAGWGIGMVLRRHIHRT